MTAEQLGAIAGVILSLLFSYVPGLSDKFGGLSATTKRLSMALLLLIVAIGTLALSCSNIVVSVPCTQAGLVSLINVYIAALVANQAAYLIAPGVSKAEKPAG
jgi:hypothetical protein